MVRTAVLRHASLGTTKLPSRRWRPLSTLGVADVIKVADIARPVDLNERSVHKHIRTGALDAEAGPGAGSSARRPSTGG